MQQPQLVASDVDGTLLDASSRPSARTVAAVAGVARAEVPFVLVTGRPPRWIPSLVAQLGHAGPVVCANGAVLYDAAAGRVIWACVLDPVRLRDAASALDAALPGCMLAAERVLAGACALPADREFLAELDYVHPWSSPRSRHAPRDELLGEPAVKLLVRHPGMTSEALAEAAAMVLGDAVAVTYSTSVGLVELSAPGVTKGSGLARVAAGLGVAAADVVAFGDMPNDLPMLRWAGHGVAMANAHPSVLAAADEVTAPNSEDGVALVLERWFCR